MAHFIGFVQGKSITSVSRLGSIKSGISARASGWDVGISVRGYVDEHDKDHFRVYLTSGSNGGKSDIFLGDFTQDDLDKKG